MQSKYAEPSRHLRKLWLEWIELHKMLDRGMKGELAAPFFSSVASHHPEDCVLLVGKATAGDYWLDSYRKSLRHSPEEAIRDRLMRNREFVSDGGNGRSFWRFFDRVAELRPDLGRDGVIWSNVAKIGSRTGNPTGLLLSAQGDLARRMLVAEVREYRPLLVVFVTANYAEKIINDAFGFTNNEVWENGPRGTPDDEVWWHRGSRDFPKVRFLWMRHPQGKTREQIDYWARKAGELIIG